MPKASKTSRSRKVETPLHQRKFAVSEKQVLEKIVTDEEKIEVRSRKCFIDLGKINSNLDKSRS
jgi:hypothetical protein